MRAGEVPGRVDHRHDDQPEDEADADRAERAVVRASATIAPQPAKTSANAAMPSAAARRPERQSRQGASSPTSAPHALGDLVADAAHAVEVGSAGSSSSQSS